MLKEKQRAYKHKLVKEMESFQKENPRAYWNTLSKLKAIDSEQKVDSSNITPTEWVKHFKHLANEDRDDDGQITKKLMILEQNRFSTDKTTLDFAFTIKEIKTVIRECKNGKACSDDMITYEMLKCYLNHIAPALT